jgi:hypothetical protein
VCYRVGLRNGSRLRKSEPDMRGPQGTGPTWQRLEGGNGMGGLEKWVGLGVL